MFYIITLDDDGHANGQACGPYATATEAQEMSLTSQVPVAPLPWILDLIERLAAHDRGRAAEHHDRDERLHAYHSGREDSLRHLAEHLSAPPDSVPEQDDPA